MNRQVHIIGGGTNFYIRPHLALSAPAFGQTAHDLFVEVMGHPSFDGEVHLYTTKMAGDFYEARKVGKKGKIENLPGHADDDVRGQSLDTNADIAVLLDQLVADPAPKIIFLPAALCDFQVHDLKHIHRVEGRGTVHDYLPVGKEYPRLISSEYELEYGEPGDYGEDQAEPVLHLSLVPAEKVLQRVRKERKDIFLVGFKTTTGKTPEQQFDAGLTLVKKASCNLVLANDTVTRVNMIVTPENAPYNVSKDRGEVLANLVDMALSRAQGHFTRTHLTVGVPVKWTSKFVPDSLREVVNHCIEQGAYKPFLGSTVGHFAFKVEENKFITSQRKTNFNNIEEVGMVVVEPLDETRMVSYGGKPSVGGQSQRIIFKNHPEMDCIVHFHCPLKDKPEWPIPVPVRSQRAHECGSHECGQNTSDGLMEFTLSLWGQTHKIKVVMLDKHGPNIVYNSKTPSKAVIDFINANWDLSRSTSEIQW